MARGVLKKYEGRSCAGKTQHGDKRTAKTAAANASRKKGEVIQAYRCVFCNGWHIGHNRGQGRRCAR